MEHKQPAVERLSGSYKDENGNLGQRVMLYRFKEKPEWGWLTREQYHRVIMFWAVNCHLPDKPL